MPRATAAATMAPVEGPRRMSSSRSRNSLSVPSRSKGVSSSAARHNCSARSKARRATSSSEYSTTTWKTPVSTVCVVRLKVTGQPAWACRPRAQNSRAWATETVSRWSDGSRSPSSGKGSRRRASKPGRSAMATSAPSQRTMAWMAVWRLHRLGPRRARMRETSMTRCSLLFLQYRAQRLLGLDGQQGFRFRQVEAVGLDAGGDYFLRQAQCPAGGDGSQHVGNVFRLLGLADVRYVAQAADAGFVGPGTQDDAPGGPRDPALAGGEVLGQLEAGRVGGEEDDFA